MKNRYAFIFMVICSLNSRTTQADNYSLVFSDEFDGTVLDDSKWTVQSGYAANQEKEYYTTGNNNLRIEDGNLVLVARKEQAVTDRDYTSARINSKGKMFTKYGKIEASISFPSGAGTWPAFWMMPESNVYGTWPKSGEIDIMEHVGSSPTMISHAVHTANKNGNLGNNWYNRQYRDNTENNFHKYSIIWGDETIQFYIDDVKSVTLWRNLTEDYKGWPFDQNFYLILNLALGGTMGGTIDDAIFDNPVEMKVDYVRIYQDATAVNSVSEDQIKVYPTRFSDELHVSAVSPCTVKLYDVMGKLFYQKQVYGNETIQTNAIPSGIYLLKTKGKTYKLIK